MTNDSARSNLELLETNMSVKNRVSSDGHDFMVSLNFYTYAVFMPIICCVGFFFTLISILTFYTRLNKAKNRSAKSSLNLLLLTLCVFDLILLFSSGTFYTSLTLCSIGKGYISCLVYNNTGRLTYFLSSLSQLGSVWTCVLLAVDRYIAVKCPILRMRQDTYKTMQCIVGVLFIMCVLIRAPTYFELAYSPKHDLLLMSNLLKSELYRRLYHFYAYLGLVFPLPWCLIILFNSAVLVKICRVDRLISHSTVTNAVNSSEHAVTNPTTNNNNNLSLLDNDTITNLSQANHQLAQTESLISERTSRNANTVLNTNKFRRHGGSQRETRRTYIAMLVVVTFFLFYAPSIVLYLIDQTSQSHHGQNWYAILVTVATLSVCVNSATNFILYCLLGREIRLLFLHFALPCWFRAPENAKKHPNLSCHTTIHGSHLQRNHLLTPKPSSNMRTSRSMKSNQSINQFNQLHQHDHELSTSVSLDKMESRKSRFLQRNLTTEVDVERTRDSTNHSNDLNTAVAL